MEFKKIGLVGVGAMGTGIADNLIKKGFEVYAYDVVPDGINKVAGIKAVDSPAALGEVCDAVITSLPSIAAVEESVIGEKGLLKTMSKGYIFDMSTIDPSTTKKMAAAANAQGVHFLDCPLSGGPMGAANGTLSTMIGASDEEFEVAKNFVKAFCREEAVVHVGPVGSGQTVKLCNNIASGIATVGIAEAVLTGVQAGVPIDVLTKAMMGSSASCYVMEKHCVKTTFTGNYEPALFQLKHMHKDVSLFIKMADELHIPAIAAHLTQEMYTTALEHGWGTWDHTAVCKVAELMANKLIVETK